MFPLKTAQRRNRLRVALKDNNRASRSPSLAAARTAEMIAGCGISDQSRGPGSPSITFKKAND